MSSNTHIELNGEPLCADEIRNETRIPIIADIRRANCPGCIRRNGAYTKSLGLTA